MSERARHAGLVVLVGAGPGDPALLTAAGARWLAAAEVVCYDRLANERLLDLCRPTAERIYVGKRPDAHAMPQERINELLVDRCRAGKLVVRLKGGDPLVFGRGGEEADALADAGLPFRIVPGVTAAVAAGAYAGIPLTDRRLAASVAFVTGHEDPAKGEPAVNYAALAGVDTVVFYMGVGNLSAIAERLVAAGRGAEEPVAIVADATTPRQRTVTATLATAAAEATAAGIRPPALVIVGKVVALRGRLAWLEKLPLFGRTVLVTRTRRQASALAARLAELGAEVIEAPTIAIAPPEDWSPVDDALRAIAGGSGAGAKTSAAARRGSVRAACDWLVLTSPNGAEALVERMGELGLDGRALAGVKIAAVGPATADVLRRHFIRPDLVPDKYTTEALAQALTGALIATAQMPTDESGMPTDESGMPTDESGMPTDESAKGGRIGGTTSEHVRRPKVLLARADIATEQLADALRAAGAEVVEVTLYRTVRPASLPPEALAALRGGRVDWVAFTSSSTVTNFLALAAAAGITAASVKLASIGPATSAALRAAGLEPSVEAAVHTIDRLIEAICTAERC